MTMTIAQVITRLDELKHNTYSQSQKIAWLSKVDSMVKRHIIDTHEGGEKVSFTGYDDDTDLQTQLLEDQGRLSQRRIRQVQPVYPDV